MDQTGLRSDANYSRSYAPKEKTPVIKSMAKRMSVNIISSITNQGNLRFMTYTDSMTSKMLIKFIAKLKYSISRKIFIILDNLAVHKSNIFKLWLNKNKDKIEAFYLPPYSPELNPDERLNRDLKMNFRSKHNTKTQKEFRENTTSDMKSIQRKPNRIKQYFKSKETIYAA